VNAPRTRPRSASAGPLRRLAQEVREEWLRFLLWPVVLLLVMSAASDAVERESTEVLARILDEYTACYRDALNLQGWDIATYHLGPEETDSVDFAAAVHAVPESASATVYYNTPYLANQEDEYVRSVVVHELVHVITAELGDMAGPMDDDYTRAAMELVAERLQHTVLIHACGDGMGWRRRAR
jgi:hypothetical protein